MGGLHYTAARLPAVAGQADRRRVEEHKAINQNDGVLSDVGVSTSLAVRILVQSAHTRNGRRSDRTRRGRFR
jgi:hypothetical protein